MRIAPVRAGALLALLAALNILNFVDRFLIQGFAVDLMADLHLTHLQFTLLTGFAFTLFYTGAGLFMGALADRVHRPRLIAAGLGAWTVLTAATGLVTGFVQLAALRTFTGIGEATLTPAAVGLLADTQPPRRRALATGVYYLGAPVGIGGAFLLAGALGPAIGWRRSFMTLGAVGLLLALAIAAVREPRPAPAADAGSGAGAGRLRDVAAALRASPPLRLLMAAGVLVIFGQGAFVLDQAWLVEERGFDKSHAQALSGAMFMAGGVVGALAGGWLADALEARRAGGRLRFLAWATLLGVPVALVHRFAAPGSAVFLPAMFVGSTLMTLGYGPLFASLQDLAPARLRSTLVAAMILGMTLIGTSGGNLLVGLLADRFHAAGLAQPITWAAACTMLPWLFAVPCLSGAAARASRAGGAGGGRARACARGRLDIVSDFLAGPWQRTWHDLRLPAPDGVHDALLARWAEPHRKYHTLQHLGECLALFEAHRALAERPGEVAIALWFHDAVYDTARHDNEAASAAWATRVLRDAGAAGDVVARVDALILATRHSQQPATPDERLLVDIDLAILGADPARFDEYERQIRAEYGFVPEDVFRTKRAEILRGFLARPALFATPALAARLEGAARVNLAGAIARLA
jgi:predicted metal-dependent HD superfamily phosphohydrolase/MFS family permease